MRDHLERPRRSPKAVGVRELKTHAARILRHVRERRASFVLTHRGWAIGVILPVEPTEYAPPASEDLDATAAWNAFVQAGRRLERRFRPGASGVRLLSASRR